MTTIASKHVLVTGGASGLGRGLALRCAALGATVSVLDLNEAGAEEAAATAAAQGAGTAAGYGCDVGDREQVVDVAGRVREAAGPVDILVNNAGVVSGRALLELTDEQIEQTFRVNTLALFWVTRAREDDVVEAIIDAVHFDKPMVQLPWMVRTLPAMRLLPVSAFDRLAELFGLAAAMDEFRGRDATASPSAFESVGAPV